MKKIIVFFSFIILFSCAKKAAVSLISVEYVSDDLTKNVVINVNDNYLVYETAGYFTVPFSDEAHDLPSSDTIFEMKKSEIDTLVRLYNSIEKDLLDRPFLKDRMKTCIEGVEGNNLITLKQEGYRTDKEKAFLKNVLQLIESKSIDLKVKKEVTLFRNSL